MRRLVAVLVLLVVPGSAVADASQRSSTSSIYPGKPYAGAARRLMPSTAESQYDSTISSVRGRPSAGKRRGFKSGWEKNYRDLSLETVNQADLVVYVYNTRANALLAYADACPSGCSRRKMPEGIRAKYRADTHKSLPVVATMAMCNNVYVAVITTSTTETSRQLAFNGGYLVGLVYGKAFAQGMGGCK
jgi:hypothetical protein